MSLLTRCPACTTIYRVVPDQLRISQGWVKCGQCGDIFDASQHLVQIEPEAQPPRADPDANQADPAPMVDVGVAPEAVDEAASVSEPALQIEMVDEDDRGTTTMMDAKPDADSDADAIPSADQAPPVHEASTADTLFVSTQDVSAVELLPQPIQMRESAIDPDSAIPMEEPATTADMADVSFMRGAGKTGRWHRPWLRALLMVLAILLAGLLALQWVYQQRHVLAVTLPTARPALQLVCDLIGCDLRPVQRIESVAIDSAAFNKLDDQRYVLAFVLKNAADLPLAVPSVELTLTNLRDQPVVRRVFLARELDANVKTLSPLAEWRINVPLTLKLDESAQQVVGYRVRVFYP